jgi:hypothetical protein
MPKVAWSVLLFPAVLLVTIVTGCGPGSDDPEVKKQIQERSAAIREDDAQDRLQAKNRKGKQGVMVKSIKGRLGGDQGPSQ